MSEGAGEHAHVSIASEQVPEAGAISGDLEAHSDLDLPFQDVHHEGALLPLPQQQLPVLKSPFW